MLIEFRGKEYKLEFGRYQEGGDMAVILAGETPDDLIKVSVSDYPACTRADLDEVGVKYGVAPGRVFLLKGYSENLGLLDCLLTAGVIEQIPLYYPVGHAHADVVALTDLGWQEFEHAQRG